MKHVMLKSKNTELTVDGISKQFDSIVLFRRLTFALQKGEILAISGPNGSGKSTLLRIIAGLTPPDTGSVQLLLDRFRLTGKKRLNAIGMTAPVFSLYPDLSLMENLVFLSKTRGVPLSALGLHSVLDSLGLSKYTRVLYRNCSTGIQQRAKLAQAIIHNPSILLLDEPGSNLDVTGVEIIKAIIKHQRNYGITIIASNEKSEIDMADHIVELGSAQSKQKTLPRKH
jgi:heme exporter protein A